MRTAVFDVSATGFSLPLTYLLTLYFPAPGTLSHLMVILLFPSFFSEEILRYPSACKQYREHILHLTETQSVYLRIIGLAFRASVPAAIVAAAVAVILSVRLVVLFVVRNEVIKREAVMAGDKIY